MDDIFSLSDLGLEGLWLTSPPIGQPLSDDALQCDRRAFAISEAKRGAVVVSEIEFAEVTLQVSLRDMVIDAIDTALEDREVPLDGVGVRVAANVFVD